MFRRNDDDEWSNEIYAISLVESSGDDRKDKYRERGELCESWPCRHTACPDCIQSWRGRPDKPFRNKLIKTIAVKARGLASFGWKVTSHRIKVACNRVRKLAGESASLIKKKKKTTRTCLDEIVNWMKSMKSGNKLYSRSIQIFFFPRLNGRGIGRIERLFVVSTKVCISSSINLVQNFFFRDTVRKSSVETISN